MGAIDLSEHAISFQPIPGELVSGDRGLVLNLDDGYLVAGIDGLGHGSEAASVATKAADILAMNKEDDLDTLFKKCHQGLIGTRGAVISLARINTRSMTLSWAGVGNVEGVLFSGSPYEKPESLCLRNGVVGDRLPSIRISVRPLLPGETLVFISDGIHSDFYRDLQVGVPCHELADTILSRSASGNDDALAVVFRFGGIGQEAHVLG